MTQQHSFLPPSGASAWSKCAMWPTMNAQYPQDDSPESIEGTAAHWVATELMAGRVHTEGTPAPNGVIVTEEMCDGAELFKETAEKRTGGMKLHIEETLTMRCIHAECFGTPDLWGRTGISKRIEILDYKWGHGFVDEYFNPQLLCYLAGIVEKELDPNKIDVDIEVALTIVQPRCYYRGEPVRTHAFKMREVGGRMAELRAAAEAAKAPNPTATTNEECDHCPGRHACSALQQSAYSDAEYADARPPHDLTPLAAARELRMLERAYARLGARVEGLRELTLANMRAGAPVPFYRIESGRGRQQWNVPVEQLLTIGKMLGHDLGKPGVVTPAQAKKYGIDEAVISAYSQHTPGNLKLVAQNNADASKVFGRSGE